MLIIRENQIGGINYTDIFVKYDKRRIIYDTVYGDSQIVGETWKYVNKNGSADKRYSNNKKLYICLCGEITFTSATGLNIVLVLSNNQIIDVLKNT